MEEKSIFIIIHVYLIYIYIYNYKLIIVTFNIIFNRCVKGESPGENDDVDWVEPEKALFEIIPLII